MLNPRRAKEGIMAMVHIPGKKSGQIMLYALSTCVWCQKTKKLLEEQSAEIQEIRARIASQLEQLASKAQVLQAELMKLMEEK